MTAVTPGKFTYDSNSLIAETQHAWVYRGTYERNKQVAVKRVLLASENLVPNELSTLPKVDSHENVLRYYYTEMDDIFCHIVMELCDTDLEKYINTEQTQDAEKILYGAAKGLAHIHDQNIVHRDLKPSNILVTKRGSELIAKICDFGISKEPPQGQTSQTATNQGTEQYKAPELFSSGGDNSELDENSKPRFSPRTDMYSFGLVVFFAFSRGEHLCGGYPENLANIKTGKLVNLYKISDVPAAKSLVLWTTAHNPKDRPAMAEVLHHPLFWDKQKTMEFIKAVSDAFEDRNDKFLKDLKECIDEDAHDIICSSPATCTKAPSEGNPTACADWTKLLSGEVLQDICSRKTYDAKSFCELVRIIRNMDSNWSQLSNKVRSEYGETRIAFHDYWTSRFPSLVVYLWDKLELTYLIAVLNIYYWSCSVRRGRFEEAFLTGVKDGDYIETKQQLKNGINVNCRTSELKKTALCLAAEYGHKEILNWLLERGASPFDKDEDQRTPIHLAALNGHVDSVTGLWGFGAECNGLDLKNCTPLHLASENGHIEVVKLLLQYRVDLVSEKNVNCTPLHLASENGHAEIVILLLDRDADINCKGEYDKTPLYLASLKGQSDVVKLLLDRGADINCKTTDNWTPLHTASQNGHAEVVKLILDRGTDINCKEKDNWTPLHLTSQNGHAEVVILLLDRGADINCKEKDNWTPLHIASQNGHAEVVKLLLDRGADINCKGKDNWTPLHLASENGHTEVAKLLLDHGADIYCKENDNFTPLHLLSHIVKLLLNKQKGNSWTPLHLASENGHAEVVKLLLDRGADVNCKGKDNWTPLHLASENGHTDVAKLLLDRGADIYCKENDYLTPLHLASENGHAEVVKLLLDSGVDFNREHRWSWYLYLELQTVKLRLDRGAAINCKNTNNLTPLHMASQNGHAGVVKLLLDHRADINCKEKDNWTPLHMASQNGHAGVVKLLLDHRVDINCKEKDNWTPLHTASQNGHAGVVKLLLDHRADINCKNTNKRTPLHFASQNGHAGVVKLLLDHGADINCKEKDNWTPLHIASQNSHVEVVKLLLGHGADINCKEKDNWTPLHLASEDGHAEVVKLLLDHRADINCKGKDNRTPVQLASQNGHAEVVKLLLDRGADINCNCVTQRSPFGSRT